MHYQHLYRRILNSWLTAVAFFVCALKWIGSIGKAHIQGIKITSSVESEWRWELKSLFIMISCSGGEYNRIFDKWRSRVSWDCRSHHCQSNWISSKNCDCSTCRALLQFQCIPYISMLLYCVKALINATHSSTRRSEHPILRWVHVSNDVYYSVVFCVVS